MSHGWHWLWSHSIRRIFLNLMLTCTTVLLELLLFLTNFSEHYVLRNHQYEMLIEATDFSKSSRQAAFRWYPVPFFAMFSPSLNKYWNDYKWNRVWEQKMWCRLHTISRRAAFDTLLQRIMQIIIQGNSQYERDGVCNNGMQDFHSAILIPNISQHISLQILLIINTNT